MTILNTPDDSGCYPELQDLPRDEQGPVFAEPWQAQAFALAVRLSAQGHFTWKEWAEALAAELAAAAERDEADDGTEYYFHWVAALEKLVAAKGLAGAPELYERKEAWADAYRHTPHGQPVQLRPGFRISYEYRQSPLLTGHAGRWRFEGDPGAGRPPVRVQRMLLRTHGEGLSGAAAGRIQTAVEEARIPAALSPDDLGMPRSLSAGERGAAAVSRTVACGFTPSISAKDVDLIYNYVERMLQGETELEVPAELAGRHFQRYLVESWRESAATKRSGRGMTQQ